MLENLIIILYILFGIVKITPWNRGITICFVFSTLIRSLINYNSDILRMINNKGTELIFFILS